MFLVEEIMATKLFGLINNNIFDNLDYKPTNEIKSLKELTNLI